MTALHPALVFLGGLAVVVLGAELLLKSATRIAHMLRISPIVIGLTVVAIGTSLPELAVGITAAAEGKGALAVGNVKYQVENGLLVAMRQADKPLYLGFREAFAKARELLAEKS